MWKEVRGNLASRILEDRSTFAAIAYDEATFGSPSPVAFQAFWR